MFSSLKDRYNKNMGEAVADLNQLEKTNESSDEYMMN